MSRTELLSLPPYVRKRRELSEGEARLNQVSRGRREQIKRERAEREGKQGAADGRRKQ